MASITPHGKGWRAQIRRRGHPTLSATFPLKRQAEAWAAQREAEIVHGRLGVVTPHTLAEALKKFREELAPKRRGGRWEVNRALQLERDPIARMLIGRLNSADLTALRDRELARGVEGTTVRRLISFLSSVFKAARGWKWMTHDPMQDFERPPPKKGRARGVSQAEIDGVVAALGYKEGKPTTAAQQTAVAFLLAIETGMRSGELLSLTWDQVFEKHVHLERSKNGDERDVPLSVRARELVAAMRDVGRERVFTVTAGNRDQLFRDARVAARLAGFTFHDSRSEAISRLSKRLDIRELARMVGHRDLNSLMIYYRDRPEDVADKL